MENETSNANEIGNGIKHKVKCSLSGIEIKDYDKMLPRENGFFQHFPGCYCNNCGETFALYSYSAMQPKNVDENKIPYYNSCFKCDNSK